MKSQLRNKLATELQKAMESPESGKVRAEPTKPTMPVYFANTIIARHLKQMGYEYTLSIFLPEAEVNIDKLPTLSDILHFVRASPSSRLYAALEQNNEQGFLVQLLEALPTLLAAPATQSSAVQTDQQLKNDRSIYDKLQALEEAYAQRTEEELAKCQEHLEERIVSVQLECEQQYKKQLQAELAHFRERELSEMRLEEKNKSHHELTRLRAELESGYRQRSEAVRKMELEMLERMKHKEQELERSIHVQRQSLLEELEGLKEKKAELDRMRVELEKKEELSRLQEEHMRKMADQLESHKRALQAMQEQCDKMAEEKARRYQIQYERNHQARYDDLSREESKLSDYDRLAGKTAELEGLLHTASVHQVNLQQEKEALMHKLSEVASLQQKLLEAERQLSDMRRKETAYLQTIKELQNKIGTHQKQLDKVTRVQAKELQAKELDNQNLRTQLDTQCQYNLELQKRLDDQTLQLRTTQRELKDLQEQVEHLQAALKATYRPAGQPVVKKRTKARFPDPHHTPRSPLNLAGSSGHCHVSRHDGDNDVWKLEGKGGHEIELTDAFLAESKSTFARLEKEAQELERSFQHLGLGYDPMDPANPTRSPGSRSRAQFQTSPWHSPPTHLASSHLARTPERIRNAAASMATTSSPAFPLISAVPYPSVTPQEDLDVAVEPAFPSGTRTLPLNSPPRAPNHASTDRAPLMMDLPSRHPATASYSFASQPSHVNGQPFPGHHTPPPTPVMTSHHLGDVLLHVTTQPGQLTSHVTTQPGQVKSHVTAQPAQLTSHVTTQPAQLTSHVTTQPAQLTSHVTTQPAQLTSHVTTQPAQLTSHVTTQPAQLTSHVTTQPAQVTSHVTTQPAQLTSHVTTQPAQLTSHVTTQPSLLTSHVTTQPAQVTSHVTTQPAQLTSHVTTQPSLLPFPQATSHVTKPLPQMTTHLTTPPTPSVPLPVTSSQQQHFLPTPAVPTFNLDSLWKSATPPAPPLRQATPGSVTNQKASPPLSEVTVEDIEDGQASSSTTGMEQRHIHSTESTPGMEQRQTNTIGVEQRHNNTAGVEQRHTTSSNLESSWEAARLQRLRQQEMKEREERERVERELKSLEQTSSKEQKEASHEQEAQGHEGVGQGLDEKEQDNLEGEAHLEDKHSKENIDPVMLKYMELVQKRREQKTQPQTFTPAEPTEMPLQVGEVALSQASGADSAVDHSEHEDAFQDW
ncbi:hypothetical protein EMCRGX_G033852 [Ephydatia muelleri]